MNIKDVKPTLNSGYRQGYFLPKNPKKYAEELAKLATCLYNSVKDIF